MSLEDPKNLASGDRLDLRDTVRITKDNTDLGRCQPLLSELADVLVDLRLRTKSTLGI